MMPNSEFTSRELKALSKFKCPNCGSVLIGGPVGGAAQNYYCTNRELCCEGFNLTFWQGELVFADRIGDVSEETYAAYA